MTGLSLVNVDWRLLPRPFFQSSPNFFWTARIASLLGLINSFHPVFAVCGAGYCLILKRRQVESLCQVNDACLFLWVGAQFIAPAIPLLQLSLIAHLEM
jgi:hypothetical protein